jgi:uncharacterized protein HemX
MRYRMQHVGGTTPPRRPKTPLWLCLVLIGLGAWIYLGQTGRTDALTARLHAEQRATADLQSQRQSALAELGRVSSPAFVLAQAQTLGMVPGDWSDTGGMP